MKVNGFSFPKEKRLLKRADFDELFRDSKRISKNGITLRYRKNCLAASRLGIMVGKRFGNAVERNRVRRVVREVFRLKQSDFCEKYDLLVTLYQSMKTKTKKEIATIVGKLFTLSG